MSNSTAPTIVRNVKNSTTKTRPESRIWGKTFFEHDEKCLANYVGARELDLDEKQTKKNLLPIYLKEDAIIMRLLRTQEESKKKSLRILKVRFQWEASCIIDSPWIRNNGSMNTRETRRERQVKPVRIKSEYAKRMTGRNQRLKPSPSTLITMKGAPLTLNYMNEKRTDSREFRCRYVINNNI